MPKKYLISHFELCVVAVKVFIEQVCHGATHRHPPTWWFIFIHILDKGGSIVVPWRGKGQRCAVEETHVLQILTGGGGRGRPALVEGLLLLQVVLEEDKPGAGHWGDNADGAVVGEALVVLEGGGVGAPVLAAPVLEVGGRSGGSGLSPSQHRSRVRIRSLPILYVKHTFLYITYRGGRQVVPPKSTCLCYPISM